jgi:hypothetical protein
LSRSLKGDHILAYHRTCRAGYHNARTNVGARTFERYAEIVRVHLAPALGHHLLPKLQPLHIQGYCSHALQHGRRGRRGGGSRP